MKRRHALVSLLSAGGLLAIPAGLQAQGQKVLVEVWKSPSCGCCKDWITHLEANGFARWQLPARMELIDAVPKTAVGKFDKKVLRGRFAD